MLSDVDGVKVRLGLPRVATFFVPVTQVMVSDIIIITFRSLNSLV